MQMRAEMLLKISKDRCSFNICIDGSDFFKIDFIILSDSTESILVCLVCKKPRILSCEKTFFAVLQITLGTKYLFNSVGSNEHSSSFKIRTNLKCSISGIFLLMRSRSSQSDIGKILVKVVIQS